MRTLIDDLLQYSQFLRTDVPRGVVDVERVARAVLADLERDEGGPPDVELQPLPAVWSGEGSLAVVLSNLIGNGLTFAREGVPPRVVVSCTRDGGLVVLQVDDNGIGIEPEYRERVFRMFQRLHVREAYPGTGIGLAIVQQVAESHGGRAWVEASPLGGCRFCVSLPPAPAGSSPDKRGAST